MDINASNATNPASEGMKNAPGKTKSLTLAVLGLSNSHGIKLSHLTSEDKKELMVKLEEWRKARREKLAATILAKQKQADSSKTSKHPIPFKPRPVATGDGNSKSQNKESVFERLYKNNGKIRNPESNVSTSKPQQIPKPSNRKLILSEEKANKPTKTFLPKKEKSETFFTTIDFDSEDKENQSLPIVDIPAEKLHHEIPAETEKHASESGFGDSSKEDSDETLKLTQADHHYVDHQVKVTETTIRSDIVLKSLPVKAVGPQRSLAVKPVKSSPVKQAQPQKIKNPIRRSLSMTFRHRRQTDFAIRRSISARNLLEINLNLQSTNYTSMQLLQHKKETKNQTVAKGVTFVTPKNTKSLTSIHLRNKLESWLKINGHSLDRYRHLRCFGVAKNEKPFSQAPVIPSYDSLDNSYYATAPNTPVLVLDKENETPVTVIPQTDIKDVENWLKELHRLIIEVKYPSERCEEWLSAIRKKCSNCTQLPIYWECLAALHESKGDIKSAIEDYERAIIKGGEVDAVGDSLAQLFDKMVIEQKKHTRPKVEKGIDPKNIFKSTIIKFALQQKALKKLSSEIEPSVRQQLYVATPVRRSTRIQTPYKSKNEVASLETLTPELRSNVTFKPNESLLGGD